MDAKPAKKQHNGILAELQGQIERFTSSYFCSNAFLMASSTFL